MVYEANFPLGPLPKLPKKSLCLIFREANLLLFCSGSRTCYSTCIGDEFHYVVVCHLIPGGAKSFSSVV